MFTYQCTKLLNVYEIALTHQQIHQLWML